MTKQPLDQMIDLWKGLDKLHRDTNSPVALTIATRNIVIWMSNYRVELEKSAPFNPVAHALLTDEGAFTYQRIEGDFDDGDPENGPSGNGHDDYDLYEGDSHDLIITRDGKIVHLSEINWDEYRFFEGMQS